MNMHLPDRCRGALPIVSSAILSFLAASSPAIGSQSGAMLFTGGAFGPTVDVAIQGAIWDAEATASVYRLFTCQLLDEPLIFPGPNPARGRVFTAQVTVACTP